MNRPDRTSGSAPELSIVVPAYKCSPCLDALYQGIVAALTPSQIDFEIVFVDDRSPDDGFDVASRLAQIDQRVRSLRLSRNFGQHAAITAGISQAKGRWTVVMDCDLQDDPADLPRLLAKAQEGYDIVLAKRIARPNDRVRALFSKMYFAFVSWLSGFRVSADFGSYSIISHKVKKEFLRIQDCDRHYVMILLWLGFSKGYIDVMHHPRYAGQSSYSLGRLIQHGTEGLFFMTNRPLKWILGLGFSVALLGLALAVYIFISALSTHPPSGWASTIVIILIMSGVIIMCAGISGIYVGRVFTEAKHRPLFVIDTDDEAEDH